MTAFSLRIPALISMFCDHVGRIYFPAQIWLICIGQLAFPIFLFQLAERYKHTKDRKQYALRLLVFAILSEIPFDLMLYGRAVHWSHQNVLWTLLLGLMTIHILKKVSACTNDIIIKSTVTFITVFVSLLTAVILRLDYSVLGLLQICLFYLLGAKGRHWLLIGTMFINVVFSGRPYLPIPNINIPVQALAVFSLLPIQFYNDQQGCHSKIWSWFCYVIYPLHMLILAMIRLY